MKELSSMDLFFLVKELKFLENQRVETFFYQNGIFYFKVYVRGQNELNGHKFLVNKLGKSLFLSDSKDSLDANNPNSFVQLLRKTLKNGFLRSLEQIDSERILKFTIEKKEKDEDEAKIFHLYLELFGAGNVTLTNSENVIINSLILKNFKDRKIRVREEYKLPPQKKISIGNLEFESLKEIALASDLNLVKFLAIELSMGGKFAEEVVLRCKFDKNLQICELEDDKIKILISKIKELVESDLKPCLVLNDKEEIVDFLPIEFLRFSDKKKTEIKYFYGVLKEYFEAFKIEVDKREKEFEKELKKLENRVKKQEAMKKQILQDSERFTQTGNKIYENYTLVEELLEGINRGAKEKGWDYVLEKVKNDEKLSSIVKKLDYKNNKIVLKLD